MNERNISRRKFLKASLASVCFIPLFGAEPPLLPLQKGKLLFRFLQINDLHIQAPAPKQVYPSYEDANVRAEWVFENLNNREFFPEHDFVILLGDMIHGGNLVTIERDSAYFAEQFLPKISSKFYPVVGNHENAQNENNPEFEASYERYFGKKKLNYSFIHKQIEFIVINNSGTYNSPRIACDARLDALETMLSQNPQYPKIVCAHIPVLPIREEEVLKKSFGFATYRNKEVKMAKLLKKYQHNIIALLTGHIHLSGIAYHANIPHISISGTASYPHDVAIYSIYENCLELMIKSLPSELWRESTAIHGRFRHKFNYVDVLHHNHEEYLRGNNDERSHQIMLNKPIV